MRFTLPQFIEHEAKIVGPLTFKQFIFIGLAGVIIFILYFSVPFSVFLVATVVLGISSLAFAFLKIGGRSFPSVLQSFFMFSLSPKIYLWKKKKIPLKIIIRKDVLKEEKKILSESVLKVAEKSQLKKLNIEIETK